MKNQKILLLDNAGGWLVIVAGACGTMLSGVIGWGLYGEDWETRFTPALRSGQRVIERFRAVWGH